MQLNHLCTLASVEFIHSLIFITLKAEKDNFSFGV